MFLLDNVADVFLIQIYVSIPSSVVMVYNIHFRDCPAGISTLIQRWNNVMPQRWNDVEFWLNMKVEWTLKFWRWFNVDIWRCFNVDLTSSDVVTTFKFSWYLVEMLQLFDLEHWFFFANCSESFCLKLFYEQHDTRTNIINQFIQERNS